MQDPADEERLVTPIFDHMRVCMQFEVTSNHAKLLILATFNQCQWQRWVRGAGFTVDANRFTDGAAYSTLLACKQEGQRLHARNARERRGLNLSVRRCRSNFCLKVFNIQINKKERHQGPDVRAAFADKWNPELSTTCALDEHDETLVLARLEELAPRHQGVLVCSAEHDGATFFECNPDAVFRKVQHCIPEYRFSLKLLEDFYSKKK